MGAMCARAPTVRAHRALARAFLWDELAIFSVAPYSRDGLAFATTTNMATPGLNVERLWSMEDGTMCLLVERVEAPRFDVCVMRGDDVIRQNRLYARGSAQMLAETWRATLVSIRAERAEQIRLDTRFTAQA